MLEATKGLEEFDAAGLADIAVQLTYAQPSWIIDQKKEAGVLAELDQHPARRFAVKQASCSRSDWR
jgi:hypothetical protein